MTHLAVILRSSSMLDLLTKGGSGPLRVVTSHYRPCPFITDTLEGLSSLCATHRYCNEIARHALEILQLATLAPAGRRHLLEAFPEPSAAGHTNGIPVLLDVAHGVAYSNDPEVT